jgi:hypothetical protein
LRIPVRPQPQRSMSTRLAPGPHTGSSSQDSDLPKEARVHARGTRGGAHPAGPSAITLWWYRHPGLDLLQRAGLGQFRADRLLDQLLDLRNRRGSHPRAANRVAADDPAPETDELLAATKRKPSTKTPDRNHCLRDATRPLGRFARTRSAAFLTQAGSSLADLEEGNPTEVHDRVHVRPVEIGG